MPWNIFQGLHWCLTRPGRFGSGRPIGPETLQPLLCRLPIRGSPKRRIRFINSARDMAALVARGVMAAPMRYGRMPMPEAMTMSRPGRSRGIPGPSWSAPPAMRRGVLVAPSMGLTGCTMSTILPGMMTGMKSFMKTTRTAANHVMAQT